MIERSIEAKPDESKLDKILFEEFQTKTKKEFLKNQNVMSKFQLDTVQNSRKAKKEIELTIDVKMKEIFKHITKALTDSLAKSMTAENNGEPIDGKQVKAVLDLLSDQVNQIGEDIHEVDVKHYKALEQLKMEMNFSSLLFMVNEKADVKKLDEIEQRLLVDIRVNMDKGDDNDTQIMKMKSWLERLTEVVARMEIIVKMNYPLAIQEAVGSGKKCLSCGNDK